MDLIFGKLELATLDLNFGLATWILDRQFGIGYSILYVFSTTRIRHDLSTVSQHYQYQETKILAL